MTANTIYICDKCGSEQDSPDDFWAVNTFVDGRYAVPVLKVLVYNPPHCNPTV